MHGVSGSWNARIVMDDSNMFDKKQNRTWPPFPPNINVNVITLKFFYYLEDGIYPRFLFFAFPLQLIKTAKGKAYAKDHNSLRKEVERLFVLLFQQFSIHAVPCGLVHPDDAEKVL